MNPSPPDLSNLQLPCSAAFLTQTVNLSDGCAVKFEIWDTAGQGWRGKDL